MKNIPTVVQVVAAAITDGAGRLLLQQRPLGKHHGGLWEFPGGKVEQGETLVNALIREVHEELGLSLHPSTIAHAATATQHAEESAPMLVLILYSVTAWSGEPHGHDGQEWAWLSVDQAAQMPLAPLDRQLLGEIAQKLG